MKNTLKKIFIVILLLFIGYHLQDIKAYIIKDIKHSMHVQYCNDLYQGRIDTCLYYMEEIKNK